MQPYEPQFCATIQEHQDALVARYISDYVRTDPEFIERFANFVVDDVSKTVGLDPVTRSLAVLSGLMGVQGLEAFRIAVHGALEAGVSPAAIKEATYQATAYLGLGKMHPFIRAASGILVEHQVDLPLEPRATTQPTHESRRAGGERAQVEIFGEAMRGFADTGADDLPPINRWLTENCFGDWYTRDGLTLAQREMVTFCLLAAQGGCEVQLTAHVVGNMNMGNDRVFLAKVVCQLVPFIGYPRVLNALACIDEASAQFGAATETTTQRPSKNQKRPGSYTSNDDACQAGATGRQGIIGRLLRR